MGLGYKMQGCCSCVNCTIFIKSWLLVPCGAEMHKSAKTSPDCINHSASIWEGNIFLVELAFSADNTLDAYSQLAVKRGSLPAEQVKCSYAMCRLVH